VQGGHACVILLLTRQLAEPRAAPRRVTVLRTVQAAPRIFGEVMGELFTLIAAGVLSSGQPTVYELADGPQALAELETRATVGKLALLP
jgi:NADPH:quinone reductase-like Zn-dependent oxidoreductase